MTDVTSLRSEVETLAQGSGLAFSWSFVDLESNERAGINDTEAVPTGDFEALIQFLALTHASKAGAIDLTKIYTFEDRHRDAGSEGCIGCMSNGLRLSLGDYLAQTVITGDLGAYAVVREGVADQGQDARELFDAFLSEVGEGGLDGRESLGGGHRSSVDIGSTTTNEQIALLTSVVDDASEQGAHTVKVLTSVLRGGGLDRGLPGYGPFKTKVARFARGGGETSPVRNDGAVYFHDGKPRFLVSVAVHGIPAQVGELPGMVVAEDLIRDISRACWNAVVGRQ